MPKNNKQSVLMSLVLIEVLYKTKDFSFKGAYPYQRINNEDADANYLWYIKAI